MLAKIRFVALLVGCIIEILTIISVMVGVYIFGVMSVKITNSSAFVLIGMIVFAIMLCIAGGILAGGITAYFSAPNGMFNAATLAVGIAVLMIAYAIAGGGSWRDIFMMIFLSGANATCVLGGAELSMRLRNKQET